MTKEGRKPPTTFRGVVAAKSGDKTIRVTLRYQVKHPKYGKIMKRTTTAHVHDEKNLANVGDTVSICECRPYSKSKNWRLVEVVETAKE